MLNVGIPFNLKVSLLGVELKSLFGSQAVSKVFKMNDHVHPATSRDFS